MAFPQKFFRWRPHPWHGLEVGQDPPRLVTGALTPEARRGDGDPLDICVISERPIDKSEIMLRARVVGGLRCVDHEEADDRIVAVLRNDNVWGEVQADYELEYGG